MFVFFVTIAVTGIRLLVDEISAERPGVDLSRVYSPNIKPMVVKRSQAAGVGRAELSCACSFIDRHAAAVRSLGGFQIVFADVFGRYENGAGRIVQQLAELDLFARPENTGGRGTLLAFASSDLHERMNGIPCADATYNVVSAVVRTVADRCGMLAIPQPAEHRMYGTMQWLVPSGCIQDK